MRLEELGEAEVVSGKCTKGTEVMRLESYHSDPVIMGDCCDRTVISRKCTPAAMVTLSVESMGGRTRSRGRVREASLTHLPMKDYIFFVVLISRGFEEGAVGRTRRAAGGGRTFIIEASMGMGPEMRVASLS